MMNLTLPFDWRLLAWRHIVYWHRGYRALWLGVIGLGVIAAGYHVGVNPLYSQYRQAGQDRQSQWRQLQQAREAIEQTTRLRQCQQRLRQAVAPPAELNDVNFPTLLAHITQLGERYGVYLRKLQPGQEARFSLQITATASFWPFVRFIQALVRLPYAIELSQVTLTLATAPGATDPVATRLVGDITLESYDYE
jgi:Tfp pilus assembly protein PilO